MKDLLIVSVSFVTGINSIVTGGLIDIHTIRYREKSTLT
jgi:hypothetical protein